MCVNSLWVVSLYCLLLSSCSFLPSFAIWFAPCLCKSVCGSNTAAVSVYVWCGLTQLLGSRRWCTEKSRWRLPSCCIILGSTRWRQMLCGEPCCLERGTSSVRLYINEWSSTPLLPLAGLKWREEIWTVKKTERCSYSSLLGMDANLQEWWVTANNHLSIQHCCIIAPLVLNIWTSHQCRE